MTNFVLWTALLEHPPIVEPSWVEAGVEVEVEYFAELGALGSVGVEVLAPEQGQPEPSDVAEQ